MKEGEQVLRWGVNVFKVLAWLSLVIQIVLGVTLLVMGGDPIDVVGVPVPARVIGALNCVAAAVYFFMLYLMASVIRLLLDLREQVNRLSGIGVARS